MVPEQIEREILIDAPLEAVWGIVTEPEHVGTWFSNAATVDLRPGGDIVLTWDEHGVYRARVEKVEPPHLFSFRWARPAGAEVAEGNSTLVEFRLAAEGDGTRLHVVESGFPALDGTEEEKARYASGNREGWAAELDELREYAATKAGVAARR
jgi:uncharacterized protein YndB with AHSA1/START domain